MTSKFQSNKFQSKTQPKRAIVKCFRDNTHGYSLIEVLMAMGLLLIISVGLLGVFSRGMKTAGTSKYITTAAYTARFYLESIRQTDFDYIPAYFAPNIANEIEDTDLPQGATWTVAYPDGTDADPLTVRVTIDWSEDGQAQSLQLTTQVTSL